ncbi:MAG TPA: diaminopimelate epimerase [Phycisphaerae bacterium]|nr:diaminopimelate epimerase [Phycisphaerae bacterium]
MNGPIEFLKFSGSGNDFLCIDNRDGRYDELLASAARVGHFARVLCRRGMGVGADGLIFACRPELDGVADIAARFFEPDGSEVELCGNGTACFAHWVISTRMVDRAEIRILTPAGVVLGSNASDSYVKVCIPLPEHVESGIDLDVLGKRWNCDFAITGVPHVIAYVDDLDSLEVPHWGPAFRYHERFRPRGANANFVQALGEGRIAVRTWEFGVEGETLACGTGSAAAAILAARRFAWPKEYFSGEKPVLVHARSGDVLRVHFTVGPDGRVTDLCLETIVRDAFGGTVHPALAAQALAGESCRCAGS